MEVWIKRRRKEQRREETKREIQMVQKPAKTRCCPVPPYPKCPSKPIRATTMSTDTPGPTARWNKIP
jgi:acyl-CoA hydrolase